jgi:hypothetical protein
VLLVIAAVVLGISSIVWIGRHHHTADPLANLPTGVYQPPSSGEMAPLPNSAPKH